MLTFKDKGTSRTQFAVLSGDYAVAHVGKEMFGGLPRGDFRWKWDFTFPGPPGFRQHGSAKTFEEVKAEVEKNWQLWLDTAALAPKRMSPPEA